MVTNQMSNVFKQAMTTFTCKKELFYQNLELLRAVLNKTTATDVDLQARFMDNNLWSQENKAPVTYIDIYDDENFSMGVFILKPDMKLPLHDHPKMHGLIKVIAGKVKITSFSLNTQNTLKEDAEAASLHTLTSPFPLLCTAEQNPDIIADASSECCVLEPNNANIHEIESVGGPAAFLDILAPPYDSLIDDNGPRKCTYFKVLKQLSPQVFKLGEVSAPAWYWNDTYTYTGSPLFT